MDGPLISGFCEAKQSAQVQVDDVFLSLTDGNNCLATSHLKPTIMHNILSLNGSVSLLCEAFSSVSDLFLLASTPPMPSSSLGIAKVLCGLSGE